MPPPARALLPLLGAIALVFTPAYATAQVEAADWSRIIRVHGPRVCQPSRECPVHVGLVWDSTNTFPKYPEVLRAVGIGGEAVVRFRVGEAGAVEAGSAAVMKSTNRAFDQNSMDAINRWRFGVEAEGRPAGPIEVEVRIIYAQMGRCPDNVQRTGTGWAGFNQLVVTTCHILIPRSQLLPQG